MPLYIPGVELPGWNVAALQNGWIDYGAPYARAAYLKDAAGIVRLAGVVKHPGTPSPPANQSVIFTLPEGMRPGCTVPVPTRGSTAATYLQIKEDGTITFDSALGYAYVLLDNLSFVPGTPPAA